MSISEWVECSASMRTAFLVQVETATLPPKFSIASRVPGFTVVVVSVCTENIEALSSTAEMAGIIGSGSLRRE
jgi:hypothetical protein